MKLTRGKNKNEVVISFNLKDDLITLKTGRPGYYKKWLVNSNGKSYHLQLLGFEKKPKVEVEKVTL